MINLDALKKTTSEVTANNFRNCFQKTRKKMDSSQHNSTRDVSCSLVLFMVKVETKVTKDVRLHLSLSDGSFYKQHWETVRAIAEVKVVFSLLPKSA